MFERGHQECGLKPRTVNCEVAVPLVTSQRGNFKNCILAQSGGSHRGFSHYSGRTETSQKTLPSMGPSKHMSRNNVSDMLFMQDTCNVTL